MACNLAALGFGPTQRKGGMGVFWLQMMKHLVHITKLFCCNCDGASFTGDREQPLIVQGLDGIKKPLLFRGKRITNAIISTLARDYNLGQANNVLLTGCSSGGLAAYLHSDYLNTKLRALSPSMQKFRVAPASGFFLLVVKFMISITVAI